MVLEKALESPLDCKEIQLVHSEGDQPWNFLGRKGMANLDSILKSRDVALPTKVHLVKAMVFPVVMYGCDSWTMKKAEHRRMNAFETVVLEETLERTLNCKEIHQSVLKEISPGYSLEGLMLKLQLQYFGHLMQRVDSLKNTLMLGGIGGRRRRGPQRMRCWITELNSHIPFQ